MKHTKSKIAVACIAALIGMTAIAQETGNLSGQLTDSLSGGLYEGASVSISELNITTVTKRDGTFRFPALPAGQYTLVIEYLGAETQTVTIEIVAGETLDRVFTLSGNSIENIVVYGQRSGKAAALNRQRMSDSLKSIVSADAIGQFPDQNAAEALQRLPGLSIERDQGEGRFVGIRGIDPNLNNVTINGVNIPSPEAGVRSVALDVIPSELIQGLEVSKTVTPDMDADAIGGSIEVQSLSAFDKQGRSASFSAQTSYNELVSKYSPRISGSFTDTFAAGEKQDVWGIAAALSFFDRDFGSDNIESNGDDEIEQRDYTITRERLGAALNLDYRPDMSNQYYFRSLYSQFSDEELRLANTFTFDGDDSEIERESKDRFEEQTILSMTAGAEHQRELWLIEYQLGYSKSEEDEPNALYYVFKGEEMNIDSDLLGQIPQITQDAAAMDLSNYEVDEVSFEQNLAEDEETNFKIDFTHYLDIDSFASEVKFGAKYRSREKRAIADITIFDGDFDDINPNMFGTGSPDWALGEFGPGLDRNGLRSYFNQNRSDLEIDALNSELESNGASYFVEEGIFAAYLMGTFEHDNLRVVAGLRYESTDFSTTGQRVELVENEEIDVEDVVNTPWQVDQDYDHLVPSINVRYELSEELIARAAYTQTIARPRFEDAAAFQIIESKTEENDDGEFETEREAEVGNPELKPYEADNFDLSIEYYPGDIGVLSAGYFYKKIDNFIIFADVAGTADWDGFDEVIQPINGEEAEVSGLELSWVKAFDNGFLIATNATFSDSEAVTFLDGERYETTLPNQSDTVGNFTLGYENKSVSLRLTMAYKSENLEEIDGDLIRMEDDHQQVDFSAKYFVNENFNVYFNAVNITDEPFYNYFGQRNINAQYEEYGRSFELGFKWTM